MLPLPLELKAAALLLAVVAGVAGYAMWAHKLRAEGMAQCEAVHAKADHEALIEATRLSNRAAANQQGIQDAKDAQLRDIGGRLSAALGELRKRPDRHGDLPNASASTCSGATGAELSGPDAGFLAGEAARANELRTQLDACQQRERSNFDSLTR